MNRFTKSDLLFISSTSNMNSKQFSVSTTLTNCYWWSKFPRSNRYLILLLISSGWDTCGSHVHFTVCVSHTIACCTANPGTTLTYLNCNLYVWSCNWFCFLYQYIKPPTYQLDNILFPTLSRIFCNCTCLISHIFMI